MDLTFCCNCCTLCVRRLVVVLMPAFVRRWTRSRCCLPGFDALLPFVALVEFLSFVRLHVQYFNLFQKMSYPLVRTKCLLLNLMFLIACEWTVFSYCEHNFFLVYKFYYNSFGLNTELQPNLLLTLFEQN